MTTYVKFGTELRLPNGDVYEVVGVLDHWGDTLKAGHYVTYLKTESGQWFLYNDAQVHKASISWTNTKDNYILLFERKNGHSELYIESAADHLVQVAETSEKEKTSKNTKGADTPECTGAYSFRRSNRTA